MTITTGTFAWQLPTGTVMFGNDIIPFVHGITGSVNPPEMQQGSALLLMSVVGKYNIEFFLGNGDTLILTGSVSAGYSYVQVPAPTEIDSWEIVSEATGSITVDILKSTNAGFPPISPLAGLGQIKLTNQRKNSGTPTGTISLAQGDYLQVRVPIVPSVVKLVTVSLKGRKVL